MMFRIGQRVFRTQTSFDGQRGEPTGVVLEEEVAGQFIAANNGQCWFSTQTAAERAAVKIAEEVAS